MMNQYKIEIYSYKPNGSIGGLVETRYADNPEEVSSFCRDYESQHQYVEDAETGELVQSNMKAYKAELYVLCYKKLSNKDVFLANFEASDN